MTFNIQPLFNAVRGKFASAGIKFVVVCQGFNSLGVLSKTFTLVGGARCCGPRQ